MQELRPGLWTWTAPHPDWTEDQGGPDGWGRDVRSYAYDSGGCLVLFDPIAAPTLIEGLVESQDVAVVLTCKWHRRSADECAERFGAHVYDGAAGDELPGDVEARPGAYDEEVLLWIPAQRALVVGDAFIGAGGHGVRVQPDSWLGDGRTHDGLRESLRPILELPIDLVLLTHGDAVENGREALQVALDT